MVKISELVNNLYLEGVVDLAFQYQEEGGPMKSFEWEIVNLIFITKKEDFLLFLFWWCPFYSLCGGFDNDNVLPQLLINNSCLYFSELIKKKTKEKEMLWFGI